MSSSESGDDMEELQSILNEYAGKKTAATTKKEKSKSKTKEKKIGDNEEIEWIKSEEEIRLEKLIFGDKEGLVENLKKSSGEINDTKPPSKKRKPVWEDEDDNEEYGSKRKAEELKSRFERINSAPKWADLDRKEEVDSDEEILQTVGFISDSKSDALQPRDISLKQLKNLNNREEGCITSIQFHPTSTVAMVSGKRGIATLYAIDGKKNEKLHRIGFKNCKIYHAKLLPCGTQAMFSTNKHFFYSYDLMRATEKIHHPRGRYGSFGSFEISSDGKYFAAKGYGGEVLLYDLKSKELIHTFKQEDRCREIKFSLDSNNMIVSSTGPTITIFDIRHRRAIHSFLDDGCIKGNSMVLSSNGKMLATGSAEGVVNIYDYQKVLTSKTPQPEKTLMNLTTTISKLNFNHSTELLGIASNQVKQGVKLAHFPTGTVFANFPGRTLNLNRVNQIEFSPSSGYMALGTLEKDVHLFRLKHFNNY